MYNIETVELNFYNIREARQSWLRYNKNSYLSQEDFKLQLLGRLKSKLICVECGENHPATLDFHHVDPLKKDFTISEAKGKNLTKIFNEMEQCVVLCANCHRKHHYEERNK